MTKTEIAKLEIKGYENVKNNKEKKETYWNEERTKLIELLKKSVNSISDYDIHCEVWAYLKELGE